MILSGSLLTFSYLTYLTTAVWQSFTVFFPGHEQSFLTANLNNKYPKSNVNSVVNV